MRRVNDAILCLHTGVYSTSRIADYKVQYMYYSF